MSAASTPTLSPSQSDLHKPAPAPLSEKMSEPLSDAAHSHPLAKLSQVKKNILLFVFAIATFVDITNVAGVGLAVAQLGGDLELEINQVAWIITSYSLCFAALLLFAGRLSDLFPATIIFQSGFIGLGILSLVTSFVTTNKYGFLILRGLGGFAGALTIPSSYHLLVHMFPDSEEQQRKLSLLGMAGGLGNVLGLVIAGLAMLASYHWFFRIMAILCLVFGALAIVLLPRIQAPASNDPTPKWKLLDFPGVILMMGFLICFILSLTNGPIDGWGSASFIAPFIISFASAIGFFVWEASIPARTAALPTSVYKIKNFIPSSLLIMVPLGFWFTSQLYYATHFQLVFGWTPIHAAAAIVPQGIAGLIVGAATQFVPQIVGKPQFFVPAGIILIIAAELLQIYSYGGQGYDYWRLVFPAYVLGSVGAMTVYFGSAVNIILLAPPEMSGVVSAWIQVVAQVGGAIALAVQAAFETEDRTDWMANAGRTFWFILAWVTVLGLQYVIFWRKPGTPEEEHALARERIAASGKGTGVIEAA